MKITLAMTELLWTQLVGALEDARELAGILAARVVEHDSGLTLLGRQLTWAPDNAYVDRRVDGLALESSGWVPAARAAVADDSVPIFVHSHPSGLAEFSVDDNAVDAVLKEAYPHLGVRHPYMSLIVAGTPTDAGVAARVYVGSAATAIDKIRIVGNRVVILEMQQGAASFDLETFDRQVRVFGSVGQRALGGLNIAVVGAGGTGSAVAEQLARLGVGALTIIDDDSVTQPTATRGYGMTVRDVGRPKAAVLAEHINAIGLGTTASAVVRQVQHSESRQGLASADVIFSCVDGHGARLVLNRWSYAHLAPVIDIGILVTSEKGRVEGIDGRVTWLSVGAACLLCRGRLDPALAYAEMLDPDERQRLAGEGYVRAAETRQPAVVTLTSYVASVGTTELLLRLFGLADPAVTELLVRVQERSIRLNRVPQRSGCFCSDPDFIARGNQAPHLDLTWPA